MIAIKDLMFSYSGDAELYFPDWELGEGSHALILGPSGCGKTTLLHLIGGLLRPSRGEIRIGQTEIQHLAGPALDKFRGAHVGFVFQKPHLIPSLSVLENVQLAAFLSGKPANDREVMNILEHLAIGDLARRKVHQISQGQAQRVAIARAVVNKPALIIGDEPTASLDDRSCMNVTKLLQSQATACNATLIIATHDQRLKSVFENRLVL